MNRYFQLFKNILILGIGSFASRLMAYVMLPLYTNVLTDVEYGTADIVAQTANLLIPLVSLSIADAVVRYAMESRRQRADAFSAGVWTVLLCYTVFLLFSPLLWQVEAVRDYIWLICVYILASLLNTIAGLFARCIGYMRLYAYAGFQNTLLVVGFNLLFLLVFRWGVTGYLLSIVVADALSAAFIFGIGGLKRYLKVRGIDRDLWRRMLRFSIPLIPNAVCWWIINLSDRYMILGMMENGKAVNGLYTIANKIPQMITIVSAIFLQAWQLSAIAAYDEADKAKFYSRVLQTLQLLVFCCASALMLLIRPIMSVLVSEAFYPSWQYVPFLLAGVAFLSFVNFYATLYVAAKRSVISLVTTLVGTVTNIVLNVLLIPVWGAQGAAVATCAAYFLIFLVRAIDCRRHFGVVVQPFWIGLNSAVIIAQAVVMILEPAGSFWYELAMFAVILLINTPALLGSLKKLVGMRGAIKAKS